MPVTYQLTGKTADFEYTPKNMPMTNVKISAWNPAYALCSDFSSLAHYTFCAYGDESTFGLPFERLVLEYSLFKRKFLKSPDESGLENVPFAFIALLFTEFVNQADKYEKHKSLSYMTSLYDICTHQNFSSSKRCLLFGWIIDFCLANELDIPFPQAPHEISGCKFVKDILLHRFYSEYARNNDCAAHLVLELVPCVCGFDFKSSPAYEVNSVVYEKALSDCFIAFIDSVKNGSSSSLIPDSSVISYPAYSGLAVKCNCAARITVNIRKYSSVEHITATSHELVKYVDNTLRRGFNIKCKIPGIHLSHELRTMVQNIIHTSNPELFKQKKRGRKPRERTPEELLKLQSKSAIKQDTAFPDPKRPVKVEIDLEKAKNLEKESWDIAKLLGVEYDEDLHNSPEDFIIIGNSSDEAQVHDNSPKDENTNAPTAFIDEWEEIYQTLDKPCTDFLRLLANGGDIRSFALAHGGLADAYIAKINEISSNIMGDILIENSALIEDYAEDVERMLCEYGKEN